MELGEIIFQTTINFPADEKFNLTSQIRRAVDSIALNISEAPFCNRNLNLKNLWDIQFDPVLRL
ncbi:four helix bundle protein [Chryseobacterium indoltheticum]|uniref:four helix bundle protein n=1 Tax=Chryseobacterium indoltheticum TaxID=254 RepID=UPI003F4918FB